MGREPSPQTSLSLLQRVQSNDQDAWSQLVHLYGPLVSGWCERAGLTAEDVGDIFQDSFRSVFQSIPEFTPQRRTGSFRSWLRSIVKARVIDLLRRRSRQPITQGGSEGLLVIADTADPFGEESDDQAAEENALVVQRALELIRPEFSPQNWDAFRAVALAGSSATDVAERLGVSPQVVRQANYRIRRRLRLVLENLTEEHD